GNIVLEGRYFQRVRPQTPTGETGEKEKQEALPLLLMRIVNIFFCGSLSAYHCISGIHGK
ncbi:MAG: hypothetical protein D3917_17985, partial [Candidatus Electrothrix sp. AX5]|nr:hypothetical protein [Candidatus Electrothrix sp. AX5]